MSDFENNIKTWVSIDNELKKINQHIKALRAKKAESSHNIIRYIESNNLDQATVQISDGRLHFAPVNHRSSLTFKYVENCLQKCIQNPEQVTDIMNYIKNSRETTQLLDIKRVYENNE
tara:strand:+ start:67 stop:420 length:354 start_codon:yes stop_codon:yes gene_type:complete